MALKTSSALVIVALPAPTLVRSTRPSLPPATAFAALSYSRTDPSACTLT